MVNRRFRSVLGLALIAVGVWAILPPRPINAEVGEDQARSDSWSAAGWHSPGLCPVIVQRGALSEGQAEEARFHDGFRTMDPGFDPWQTILTRIDGLVNQLMSGVAATHSGFPENLDDGSMIQANQGARILPDDQDLGGESPDDAMPVAVAASEDNSPAGDEALDSSASYDWDTVPPESGVGDSLVYEIDSGGAAELLDHPMVSTGDQLDDLRDFDLNWKVKAVPDAAVLTPLETVPPAIQDDPAEIEYESLDAVELMAAAAMMHENAQLLEVPKDTSVVIDANANIDSVEVSDPNIIEVVPTSPMRLVVTGKQFGATQLIMQSENQGRVFNITVERDLSRLRDLIYLTASDAEVEVHSVNGTIVLTGRVPDARTAGAIVELASLFQEGEVKSQLRVAGLQQVLLEVVFAEVSKDATRQLGINWAFGASRLSRDFFFASNIAQLNPTAIGSSGVPDVLTGGPTFSILPNANGGGTNFTFGFPRVELQMFLNALRENGLARTLAEPNLVAINGETATFLAGGEIPIPVAQGGAAAGAITIEYKEFGIRLEFTPQVMGQRVIRLDVMAEVSGVSPETQMVGGLPAFRFTTRRVESTVECGDSESFAIAGLLNEDVRGITSKIPGLGDIPILGTLFSSVQYQKSTTELVILVTPHLVEPIDSDEVPPLPGMEMTDPNDLQLFGLQKLEGKPGFNRETGELLRRGTPSKRTRRRPSGPAPSSLHVRGPWGMADPDNN